MFDNVYAGKKVLVTGHTGFKGTWLTSWLLNLGANVIGISDEVPTDPSMFIELTLESRIQNHFCDIRDLELVTKIILDSSPDFIFHLAAQAIVSTSYQDPIKTISTNVVGTAVILEALRLSNLDCVAVIITSDKCYENVEWEWGYKETDVIGGKDIYSGSKGAAECIFHSYYCSFFMAPDCKQRIASARAGNVIGGGDWAKDRIVVDCFKSWSVGDMVEIRSPDATRPWQHVLEPLSGYLALAVSLYKSREYCGESFNFGPKFDRSKTVLNLIQDLSDIWADNEEEKTFKITDNIPFHEAGLLKLNCEKSLYKLYWEATLSYEQCVEFVGSWYVNYYKNELSMYDFTMSQIAAYENIAIDSDISWAKI
jgi:CDP-glucose 4,6-dehydratase